MRKKSQSFSIAVDLPVESGGEPLTPEDVAEIIVFAATRRENVVFADSLVFPSHQVTRPCTLFDSHLPDFFSNMIKMLTCCRQLLP